MRSWTIGLTIWYMNKFTNTLKSKLTSHSWRHGQKINDVEERKSFNCLVLNPFFYRNWVRVNNKVFYKKKPEISSTTNKQAHKQTILSYQEETLQAAASESNPPGPEWITIQFQTTSPKYRVQAVTSEPPSFNSEHCQPIQQAAIESWQQEYR